MKNTNILDIAPISKTTPKFKFPEFHISRLNSGIEVYLFQDKTQALFDLNIIFHRGAFQDDKPGLSLCASNLFLKGAKNKKAQEIAHDFDMLGATVSSSARWDDTVVSLNIIADKVEPAIDLLAHCILKSDFKKEEIERQKQRQIATITHEKANSAYLSQIAFNSLIFRGMPYSNLRLGSVESVKSIERKDCVKFHDGILKSTRVTIIVSGNFSKTGIMKILNEKFGFLNKHEDKEYHYLSKQENENKVVLIEKPGAVQTTIRLGMLTLNKKDPDYFSMQLVNCIFGGYFMSRLNHLLREKKGFTYGIHSSISSRKYASAFLIGADINMEATKEAVTDIFDEMTKMTKKPVRREEVDLCVQYMIGSFVRSIETPQQVNSLLHGLVLCDTSKDYYDKYFAALSEMSPESIFNAQQKYMNPKGITIAAAGNLDLLKEHLSGFGKTYISDMEGNLKEIN